MNIASVKFKGIENIYTRSKQEIKQTVKANNKDTIEISDLGMYLNKVNSSEDKDRLEKIAEIKSKIENLSKQETMTLEIMTVTMETEIEMKDFLIINIEMEKALEETDLMITIIIMVIIIEIITSKTETIETIMVIGIIQMALIKIMVDSTTEMDKMVDLIEVHVQWMKEELTRKLMIF